MKRFALVASLLALGLTTPIAASAQAPVNPVSGTSASGVKYLETPVGKKPRVIITADPELDDSNSMVRYILHATD